MAEDREIYRDVAINLRISGEDTWKERLGLSDKNNDKKEKEKKEKKRGRVWANE